MRTSFDGDVGVAQTQKCVECGEYGASVRCSATNCRRWFHLPCTSKCKHDAGGPPLRAASLPRCLIAWPPGRLARLATVSCLWGFDLLAGWVLVSAWCAAGEGGWQTPASLFGER